MKHDIPRWSDASAESLRATASAFLRKAATPRLAEWSARGHVDRRLWQEAGELGLLCAAVPEEYGGGGGTIAHDMVVFEETVRADARGFGNLVHSGIVAHYILGLGTEEQKQRWLPGMASGRYIGALAMSEPGAGSDVAAIATRAKRVGDGFALTGAKTFISNGTMCDFVVVAAKTDPSAGARGISLFIVDSQSRGFQRGRTLEKIGCKSQDTAELFFDDVRVRAQDMLGQENRGFQHLMVNLARERVLMALDAVTAAERAVQLAVEHTRERRAYGRPLFDLQGVRFELAECATLTSVTRSFVDDCVIELLDGQLSAARAAMAKYWATDVQGRVIDRMLQLFGGYGYMLEFPIAQLYVDARYSRIAGGANEVMKEIIAHAL